MPNPITVTDNGNPNVNTNRCFFMPTPINHGLNFPAGVILPFAGKVIPDGWLLCDGSAVSRTKYGMLFNAIGTTYGEGDGNTTFNLPNLVDRFIEGGNTETCGTSKEAGLPNITGYVGSYVGAITGGSASGAFTKKNGTQFTMTSTTGSVHHWEGIDFDANKSNSIYGKSNTVQPSSIQMCYIIRI